jgi:CheY-like chemotaxis protein
MMTERDSPRILLFDDDDSAVRGLQEHLTNRLGWHVDLAADEGLLARLASDRYDLLLVDSMIHTQGDVNGQVVRNVQYPAVIWRKTGLEFLRRLRRGDYGGPGGTSPDAPVIILSAIMGPSIESELGVGVAVQEMFEKPFRLDELVRAMCRLLKEKCDVVAP